MKAINRSEQEAANESQIVSPPKNAYDEVPKPGRNFTPEVARLSSKPQCN